MSGIEVRPASHCMSPILHVPIAESNLASLGQSFREDELKNHQVGGGMRVHACKTGSGSLTQVPRQDTLCQNVGAVPTWKARLKPVLAGLGSHLSVMA